MNTPIHQKYVNEHIVHCSVFTVAAINMKDILAWLKTLKSTQKFISPSVDPTFNETNTVEH